MDFDDTPREASFRAEARAWLDAHAPAKGSPEDFSGGYLEGTADAAVHIARAKEWQRLLFDHGWAGITWPVEHGGRGQGALESSIWNQEMARYGVTVGPFAVGIGMAGPTILRHGTDAQRERFLRPMLRGDEMWCQLFSEPEAGSDLAALRTRAVRDGDEWVVDGQKVWTSSADHADWGILLARTDPDATKRKGITYFLVDMRTPGIEIRPLRQMTGSSHFGEVFHGYRLQTALSQGRQPGPEVSVMKLFAAEYLRRLGGAALELLGADGMRAGEGPGDGAWQARFLHAPAIGIAGGSNEVQRNIIGERVLGLPREPQVDGVPFRDLVSGRR